MMSENIRDTWATPPDLMEAINRHWPVDLDVCADADNAKASDFDEITAETYMPKKAEATQ